MTDFQKSEYKKWMYHCLLHARQQYGYQKVTILDMATSNDNYGQKKYTYSGIMLNNSAAFLEIDFCTSSRGTTVIYDTLIYSTTG
jgi:hypothetical protein